MIPFSESTSLYFYSALLQGNAALITLVAMFLVYRKQYLDSVFDDLEKRIIDYLSKAANVVANYGNIFNFEKYNEEICKDLNDSSKEKLKKVLDSSPWIARFGELRTVDTQRKNLWRNSVVSIRLAFIILGSSVIMLPLSDQIHSCALLELSAFLVYVVSEIIMLILLFKFIKEQSI